MPLHPDEGEVYRRWCGLIIGSALSLAGFWAPLGVGLWRWLR